MWGFKRKQDEVAKWLTRSEQRELYNQVDSMLRNDHPLIDKTFLEKVHRALAEIEDCRSLIINLSQTHIAAAMAKKYQDTEKRDKK